MLRRNVTTVILAALISLGPTIGIFAQNINLDALLARNENQPRPAATEGDMKMIIINKAGQQRVREIKAYSKTEADDTTKQSLIFLSPADVRDTRFLTIDYKDPAKNDEQYIYIPALRKVRTIGTSGGESKREPSLAQTLPLPISEPWTGRTLPLSSLAPIRWKAASTQRWNTPPSLPR
jgi:hypothetical protein